MIKQAIAGAGLAPFAVVGLMLFVGIFVGISIWAFTRRSQQLTGWSAMPLADGHLVNSLPISLPLDIQQADSIKLEVVNAEEAEHKSSCGKCENCTCDEEEPTSH